MKEKDSDSSDTEKEEEKLQEVTKEEEPESQKNNSQEKIPKQELKDLPKDQKKPQNKTFLNKKFSKFFVILKIIYFFYILFIGYNLFTNTEFYSNYQYKLKKSIVKLRKIIDEKYPYLLARPEIFNRFDYDILLIKTTEIIYAICGLLIFGSLLNIWGLKFIKFVLFIGILLHVGVEHKVFLEKEKNWINISKVCFIILGLFL